MSYPFCIPILFRRHKDASGVARPGRLGLARPRTNSHERDTGHSSSCITETEASVALGPYKRSVRRLRPRKRGKPPTGTVATTLTVGQSHHETGRPLPSV